MDTAAGLGLGNTLYAVYAALVFENGICALAVHHELNFLHAADTGLVDVHELGLPMSRFNIVDVHPVQLRREQCSLVTACAGTNLHNYVFLIKRILRQKKDLHLFLESLDIVLCRGKLFLEHLPHVFITLCGKQILAVGDRLLCLLISGVCRHEGHHLALFLHQFTETVLVARNHRVRKLQLHFLISLQEIFQFVKHDYSPLYRFCSFRLLV